MKAAIYVRVSSEGTAHGNRQNTDRQIEDLRAYAHRNDIAVEKVFSEERSGYKGRKDRPVLDECLKFCVANHIDVILLSELSRMGRNTEDILKNVMFCKESHLNVYFQKEQMSIFTPDGKPHPFLMIFISILGTIAEMEGENIKFRLNSGREKYIRDGGKLGRKEGYRKQPDDYERDYPDVFKHLRRRDRLSYDNIAKICGCSKHTVITCARLLSPANQKTAPTPAGQKTD